MNGYRKKEEEEEEEIREEGLRCENHLPPEAWNELVRTLRQRFELLVRKQERERLCRALDARSRALGIRTLSDYLQYLFDANHTVEEFILLFDLLTGRRNRFFHNPSQLEYLTQYALPELIKHHGAGINRKLVIWSAGCNSGEETYSLAMVLKEFSEHFPGIRFDFQILGTDVSSRTLEKAASAVYEMDHVKSIPVLLKKKFLLKSKDRFKQQVRVGSELRQHVVFRQLDFLDPRFGLREKMDAIFCRDVIRYYDNHNKEQIVHRLCDYLLPGGYLFLGESETLRHLRVPLEQMAPAIYQLPR